MGKLVIMSEQDDNNLIIIWIDASVEDYYMKVEDLRIKVGSIEVNGN